MKIGLALIVHLFTSQQTNLNRNPSNNWEGMKEMERDGKRRRKGA